MPYPSGILLAEGYISEKPFSHFITLKQFREITVDTGSDVRYSISEGIKNCKKVLLVT